MSLSFWDWYEKTQWVEGECNCHMEKHFNAELRSSKGEDIKGVVGLMKQYIEFIESVNKKCFKKEEQFL